MAIWMDLTSSMSIWQDEAVGMIRMELEIARALRKVYPELRFCRYVGDGFWEIPAEQLSWLWDCKNIRSAYLGAMNRTVIQNSPKHSKEVLVYTGLERAYMYSENPFRRALAGIKTATKCLPRVIRAPLKACYRVARSCYRLLFRRKPKAVLPEANTKHVFSHPFQQQDLVFACSWTYSRKEQGFEKVRQQLSDFKVVYMLQDLIPLEEDTARFFDPGLVQAYREYLHWATLNCDALLCAGEETSRSLVACSETQKWPSIQSTAIVTGYAGVEAEAKPDTNFFKENGIKQNFILVDGSYERCKNYETLYRAYTVLGDQGNWPERCQLVIMGREAENSEFSFHIQQDPRTKERILFVVPTEDQRALLYRKSRFVLLPNVYQGWQSSLMEALDYGKLVIAADIPAIREVAGDFVEYTDPYDPYGWAENIRKYSSDKNKRIAFEKHAEKWNPSSWETCAEQILDSLLHTATASARKEIPTLYIDMTLTTWLCVTDGKISGIPRTELMLLKLLYPMYPKVKMFALLPDMGYREIHHSSVEPLLKGNSSLAADLQACRCAIEADLANNALSDSASQNETAPAKVNPRRAENMGYLKEAFWYFVSCLPQKYQQRAIEYGKAKRREMLNPGQKNDKGNQEIAVPFQKGDVIFSAGTGYSTADYQALIRTKRSKQFKYCNIIYDYTPILVPQTHTDETKAFYPPFLDFSSKMSDYILYGGRTAQKDGIAYQKQHKLPIPKSYPIFFGSNATVGKGEASAENDRKLLGGLGVTGKFVLSVGSIEARKNYETLYRAYLRMLKDYDDVPQMVICGHPGWRTKTFLETLANDERVKGKLLVLSPSDAELDALYRNCEFTILASLYEGWSLTLPESLCYGKFCLCCDTPALRETAGELSDYVAAFDEKTWAERIEYYHCNPDELKSREGAIAANWHAITWEECAQQVMGYLNELLKPEENDKKEDEHIEKENPGNGRKRIHRNKTVQITA